MWTIDFVKNWSNNSSKLSSFWGLLPVFEIVITSELVFQDSFGPNTGTVIPAVNFYLK